MTNKPQLETFRDSNVDATRVIQVVEVVSIFGEGETRSPIRIINKYFDLDGNRLARSQNDSEYFPPTKEDNE